MDVGPGTEGALHTLEVIIPRGIIQLPEREGEGERERWDEEGRGGVLRQGPRQHHNPGQR